MHILILLIALVGQSGGSSDGAETAGVAEVPSIAVGGDEAVAGDTGGPDLVAEPQQPTGRFTTATEIRPILDATRANWVAVREFNGQDLVYFTHLLAWRCGLLQMSYAVNGGPFEVYPLPPCHEDEATPNAIKPEDGLPYIGYGLGSVERVDVRITYDDLGTATISVDRKGVHIP